MLCGSSLPETRNKRRNSQLIPAAELVKHHTAQWEVNGPNQTQQLGQSLRAVYFSELSLDDAQRPTSPLSFLLESSRVEWTTTNCTLRKNLFTRISPRGCNLVRCISCLLCFICIVYLYCIVSYVFISCFTVVCFSKLISGGNIKTLFCNKLYQDCVTCFATNEG